MVLVKEDISEHLAIREINTAIKVMCRAHLGNHYLRDTATALEHVQDLNCLKRLAGKKVWERNAIIIVKLLPKMPRAEDQPTLHLINQRLY